MYFFPLQCASAKETEEKRRAEAERIPIYFTSTKFNSCREFETYGVQFFLQGVYGYLLIESRW